ncbi:hypothetical protein REPUB_Repub20aG0041000 [Reevesia pubescens]
MEEARRVFQLMIKKGCAPDTVSYNTIMNGYCKAKRLDEAIKLFREMSQKGQFPDFVTYNTLIKIFEVVENLIDGVSSSSNHQNAAHSFVAAGFEMDSWDGTTSISVLCPRKHECENY